MPHLELVPLVIGETVVYSAEINLNLQKIRNCLYDVTPTVFVYNIYLSGFCVL